ncbi:MAG TPA: hypothetical protein VK574_17715 [Terracidiphilus sp.]|nr:hypothetical protein [Terracidiphilus sp.]
MRASELAKDRRKVRYTRLRKAVESGLEDASVLSANQPKRKKRNNKLTSSNVAVDPQLPDQVMSRLINLEKQSRENDHATDLDQEQIVG